MWTASLPCQPFSAAGKRKGTKDERHLWPVFRELVAQCLPPIIFGEQVSSKDGRAWLSDVRFDLKTIIYWSAFYENMLEVRRAKAEGRVQEVFRAICRWFEGLLQGLSTKVGEEVAGPKQETIGNCKSEPSRKRKGISGGVRRDSSGSTFDRRVPQTCQAEGTSVQSRSVRRGDRGPHPDGSLRNDWHSLRFSRIQAFLEQSLNSSTHTGERLCVSQRSCDLLRDECRDVGLGGRETSGSPKHVAEKASTAEEDRELAAMFREEVKASFERLRKLGIHTDLEELGYVVGATDLCAAGAGEEGYQISHGWIGEDEEEAEAEVRWDAATSCTIGAPHIRQRLYWGACRPADKQYTGLQGWLSRGQNQEREGFNGYTGRGQPVGGLADSETTKRWHSNGTHNSRGRSSKTGGPGSLDSGLADAHQGQRGRITDGERRECDRTTPRWVEGNGQSQSSSENISRVGNTNSDREKRTGGQECLLDAASQGNTVGVGHPDSSGRDRPGVRVPGGQQGQTNLDSGGSGQSSGARCGTDHWSSFSCIPCADGKTRRIPESQSLLQCMASGLLPSVDQLRPEEGFPLAQGVEGRPTKLRGIGNSIVPQLAAIFIEEFLSAVQEVLP